jgi:hypothetical protein
MAKVGAKLADSIASGPGDALIEGQKGTKSLSQAFADMATGIYTKPITLPQG